jgi:hypothetical protein
VNQSQSQLCSLALRACVHAHLRKFLLEKNGPLLQHLSQLHVVHAAPLCQCNLARHVTTHVHVHIAHDADDAGEELTLRRSFSSLLVLSFETWHCGGFVTIYLL